MPSRNVPPNPPRQATTSYHPLSNSIAALSPPQNPPQPPPPPSSPSQNTQLPPGAPPAYRRGRLPTLCPLPPPCGPASPLLRPPCPDPPAARRVQRLAGHVEQPPQPQPRRTTIRFGDAVEADVEEMRSRSRRSGVCLQDILLLRRDGTGRDGD
ncbi:hypothetical protein F4809DRAFT_641198 [Biscogniauxia mediterranea]|nr:hypothetical protein F4809DRAFT_641198 [Biscogniauxia mediterranea]